MSVTTARGPRSSGLPVVEPVVRGLAGPAADPRGGPTVEVGCSDDQAWDVEVLAVAVAPARTVTSDGPVAAAGSVADRPVTPDRLAVLAAARYGVDLPAVIAQEKVTGRAGEVVRVPVLSPSGLPARFLLVGVGAATPTDLRRAGAALARAVRGRRSLATSLTAGLPRDGQGVRAFVEGLVLAGYTPPSGGKAVRTDSAAPSLVRLIGTGRTAPPAASVHRGLAAAQATLRARDLAATPSNVKNPRWIAERARALAVGSGLEVTVWEAERLAAEGFGGLLAVGAASATPPCLVRLDHRPPVGGRRERPIVLIGKGITFDTGGLSIKPRDAMVAMKTDMSGAAAVLAALAGCAELGVRRHVIGLLPLAENAVGGSAYRPGDVVRHVGGRTVEVANTDAEGRMVLADALAYADAALDPDVIVDLATLTGSASLGLGKRHAALFTGDERLATALEAAAAASGERVWRMPLVEDYLPALDSGVADLRHVPRDSRVGGGAITAALFLRAFAGRRRWAHLDIAGPARADRDEHEVVKGATGFGARLLLRWLEELR